MYWVLSIDQNDMELYLVVSIYQKDLKLIVFHYSEWPGTIFSCLPIDKDDLASYFVVSPSMKMIWGAKLGCLIHGKNSIEPIFDCSNTKR